MRRNSFVYIACFSLAAALAITFVTAAGTAVLAGHCGSISAKGPFAVVKAVLEKKAADGGEDPDGGGPARENAGRTEMPAAAVEDGADEARLAMLTARIALIMLTAVIFIVTAVFVIRRRKK